MDWQFRLPPAGSGIVMRHFDSRRDRRTLGMADSNNMSMQFGNDTAGCAKNSLPNNHPPTSSIQFFHTLHSSFPQNASSHKSLDKTTTAFVGLSFREITTGVGSVTWHTFDDFTVQNCYDFSVVTTFSQIIPKNPY